VITWKLHEVGCQLVLITNRKSHTGFRLVPSVTLNDLERRNSPPRRGKRGEREGREEKSTGKKETEGTEPPHTH